MKSLKELREHNNLKQKEVAQHIGVSDRVYSYYEKGRTLPAKYVKPLANLFGISCDEFLENDENRLYWDKEFGCIERTERLELPTWESVYIDLKDYKDGDFYIIDNDHFSFVYNKGYVSPQLFLYTHNEKFNWNANKENYYQACKLAKKIFLGEIE